MMAVRLKVDRLMPRAWLAMALLLSLTLTQGAFAEGDAPSPEPAEVSEALKQQAGLAYDALIDSANERYAGVSDEGRTELTLALLDEFEAYARQYAGTDEAVSVLLQSAQLARMAQAFDRGEANLKQAAAMTDRESTLAEIRQELKSMQIRPGAVAPEFSVPGFNGESVTLSDLRGKVVLLDFWATWCAPCIAELPHLKSIYETYGGERFEVLSISLDQDRDYAKKFVEKSKMDWVHVFSANGEGGEELAELYGAFVIPRMILLDENGVILEERLSAKDLEAALKQALGDEI